MNITQLSTNQLVRLYLYSLEIYDPFLKPFFDEVENELRYHRKFDFTDETLYELVDLNGHVVRGEIEMITLSIPHEFIFGVNK